MVKIKIDGLGEIKLDDSFADLPKSEQDKIVEGIVAQAKGNNTNQPEPEKDHSFTAGALAGLDRAQALGYEGLASVGRSEFGKDWGLDAAVPWLEGRRDQNIADSDSYNYARREGEHGSIYDAIKARDAGGVGKALARGVSENMLGGGASLGTSIAGGLLMGTPGGQIPGAALLTTSAAMSGLTNLGEQQEEKRARGLDVSGGATPVDVGLAAATGALDATVGRFGAGRGAKAVASRFAKETGQEGAEETVPLLSADLQGADVEGEEYLRSAVEGAAVGAGTRGVVEPINRGVAGVGNALVGRTAGIQDSVEADPNKAMSDLNALNDAVSSGVDADLRIGTGHDDSGRNPLSKAIDYATGTVDSINPANLINPENKGEGNRLGRVERYRNTLDGISRQFHEWINNKDNEGVKQALTNSTSKLKIQDFVNSTQTTDELRAAPLYKALAVMDKDPATSSNMVDLVEKLFEEKKALGPAASTSGRAKSAQGLLGYQGNRSVSQLGQLGLGAGAVLAGLGAQYAGIVAGGVALKGRQRWGEWSAKQELQQGLERYHNRLAGEFAKVNPEIIDESNPFATTLMTANGGKLILKALPKANKIGVEIVDDKGTRLSKDNTKAVFSKVEPRLFDQLESLARRAGVSNEVDISGVDANTDKNSRDYESKVARKAREDAEKQEAARDRLMKQSRLDARSTLGEAANILRYSDVAPDGFDMDLFKATIRNLTESVSDSAIADPEVVKSLTDNLKLKIKDYNQRNKFSGRRSAKQDKARRESDREEAKAKRSAKEKEAIKLAKEKAKAVYMDAQEAMKKLKEMPQAIQEKRELGNAISDYYRNAENPNITLEEFKVSEARLRNAVKKAKIAQRDRMNEEQKDDYDYEKVNSMLGRIQNNPDITPSEIVDRITLTHGEATKTNAKPTRFLQGLSSKYAIAVAYEGKIKPKSAAARALGKKHPEALRDSLNAMFLRWMVDPKADMPTKAPSSLTPEQKMVFMKSLDTLHAIASEVHSRNIADVEENLSTSTLGNERTWI